MSCPDSSSTTTRRFSTAGCRSWIRYCSPEIQPLVREGRWCIGGGWDLQPDVNMPGTEAMIRHIAEGRRYFREFFGVAPGVAYNFDSFGHSGGLPQLLARAGYALYVHMRPERKTLIFPPISTGGRGVDGTEIGVYRLPFPGIQYMGRSRCGADHAGGGDRALTQPRYAGLLGHGRSRRWRNTDWTSSRSGS